MRYSIKKVLLLIVFAIGVSSSMAQQPDYITKNITTDDGLADNNIHCIIQDSYGFMWFGSEEGLHRYDGYSIEVFRHDPNDPNTICANVVQALYEDAYKRLWIGTEDGGLSIFDLKTEQFIPLPDESNFRLTSKHIYCFAESKNNYLWVGTANGLNRLQIGADNEAPIKTVTHYWHDANDENSLVYPHVYSVLEDSKGTLWAGTTEGGLSRLDSGAEQFKNYRADKRRGSISSPAIMTIYEDREGRLWFGTWAQGLNLYIENRDSFITYRHNANDSTSISHNNVYALCEDKEGNMWAGTYDGGLNRLIGGKTPRSYKFMRFKERQNALKSLFKNKVKVIYSDNQGNLYAGTLGGGVIQITKDQDNFIHLVNSTKTFDKNNVNRINNLAQLNDNELLLATPGGLFQLDKKPNGLVSYEALLADSTATPNLYKKNITAVHVDEKGHYWVGTEDQGLMHFVIEKDELVSFKQFTLYKPLKHKINGNYVLDIIERNGHIWVITKNGINIFDNTQQRFIFEKADGSRLFPTHEVVIAHHIDSQNRLWIATQYEGLFCFSIDGETSGGKLLHHLNRESHPIAIADKHVLSIADAGNGELWVGTTKGLNLINIDKGTNKVFKEKEGLPSSAVSQIYNGSSNVVWFGTLQGMARYNRESGVFTPYYMSGGFATNYFIIGNIGQLQGGMVAMPTRDGLWAFHPDSVQHNPYNAKPVLRKISLAGQEVKPNVEINNRIILEKSTGLTKEINLRYDENVIQLEFSSISFFEQEKNNFMYRLEGLEEEWNLANANHRSVVYSNLSPGSYLFRLKASNNDGEWSQDEATLRINIKPPIYKTWYAYLSYFVFLLGALFLTQRIIVVRIQERERLKRDKIEREKETLMHQMKIRFFTNISHEFRTPLTLIAGPLQEILDHDSGISSATKSQLSLMKNNTDRLLRLINQLMDFRKVTQGNMHLNIMQRNINSFIKRIAESFQGIADQKSITFECAIDSKPLMVWFDSEKLETIIFNLLSNAFKYTPKGGKITIELMPLQKSKQLQIVVSDTGTGVPDADKPKIFDRFYQSEENQNLGGAGTGVGLSLVKELVQLHKGKIKLKDNTPSGTIFTIDLCVNKNKFNQDEIIEDQSDRETKYTPTDVTTEISEPIVTSSGDKPKVLIIEDQNDLRSYLASILQVHYRVDEAENGVEGLEKASSSLPDIIISDVMMPEMDGFTFCDKLKKNVITSHIPVILLTALDNIDSKREGLETGADAYVVKPFEKQLLVSQIQNLLNSRQLLKSRFKEQWDFVEEIATTSTDQQFVNRAIQTVEDNMSDANFNVSELVKKMNVSRTLLHMKLRELTGQSTSEFIRTIRLKQAAKLLKQGDLNVSEVTYQVGFNDPKYFSKSFKNLFGVTPTLFQKGDASGGELTK